MGHLATCYDESWVYYSIDGCLPPVSSSAKALLPQPTATGPSATESTSAASEPKVHTGIIVGSVVAGASCVIITLGGILIVLRRRRRTISASSGHELSGDRALAESDADAEKKHPKELLGDDGAVEIGRNSRFEDSLPRQRTDPKLQEVRGVNPLIRVYYVP